MVSKTHNAIAFALLVTLTAFYPPSSLNLPTLIGAVVGNNIGALISDLDTSGNYLWGLLPQGKFLGKCLKNIFYKHRTITHSLLGTFLVYKFFEVVLFKLFNPDFVDPKIVLISIMIGFVSHLLADSLTEEGVPLLFPLKFTFGIPPIKKVRIKTGHWFENIVVFPLTWIFTFYIIKQNYSLFLDIFKNLR